MVALEKVQGVTYSTQPKDKVGGTEQYLRWPEANRFQAEVLDWLSFIETTSGTGNAAGGSEIMAGLSLTDGPVTLRMAVAEPQEDAGVEMVDVVLPRLASKLDHTPHVGMI